MNPLPRPAVIGAAASLFGVSLLGLYIGIHDSLSRPGDEPTATGPTDTALRPGMAAAIQAQPLKPDALAASSAPAQVAQSSKPKPAASDEEDNGDEDVPESSAPAARHPVPEPPPLYSLDNPPPPSPPPPPSQDNSPPF
jgi:hypothetical protein